MFSNLNFTHKNILLYANQKRQNINTNINNTIYDVNKIQNDIKLKLKINFTSNHKDYDIPFSLNKIYDVNKIRRKGVKIINNVYQSKYNYNKTNCTGLGDFIRGSYFILEFCEKYNFIPKIVFNSIIGNFLKMKTHNLGLIQNLLVGIDFFSNNNWKNAIIQNGFILEPEKNTMNIMADFVDYVVVSPMYYGNVFLFCNSFPVSNVIPEKYKKYMRKIMEPNEEIKMCINNTLVDLNLIRKQYSIIHIRSGDSYLKGNNNTFSNNYMSNLTENIKNDIKNVIGHDNKYLVIADNNEIKLLLKQVFPHFIISIKNITHFGEGIILEKEKVKNTLVDFYLLSLSNSIMSYSSYEHGSGFSYWCAMTYNIPYSCKYIK
jgi:hypothetical protein